MVLDGWGCAPDGPGNAIARAAHAGLRRAARALPARRARRLRRGGRPAARADGQLRGRAPQHRRRARRLPGADADLEGDRRRRRSSRTACWCRPATRRRGGGARSTSWACSRTAACTATWGTSRRASSWRGGAARRPRRRARLPRRPRHAAAERRGVPRRHRAGHGRASASAATASSPGATTPWTATGAGSAPSSPTTPSSTARASSPPTPRPRVAAGYARGENDEFVRPTVVAPDPAARVARRRRLPLLQLPPRPRATAHARLLRARLRRVRPRPAPAGRRRRHHDALQEGVPAAGGLRAAAPRATCSPRCSPRTGCASSTSPRPRSTPTSPSSSTVASSRRSRARPAILVPSPRDVPTYDHKPEMSAVEVTDELVRADRGRGVRLRRRQLRQRRHGRAHRRTSTPPCAPSRPSTPASAASSTPSLAAGGVCLVTADHGNSDHMLEPDGAVNTAHSTQPRARSWPPSRASTVRDGGRLCDLAPTVLHLLGVAAAARR